MLCLDANHIGSSSGQRGDRSSTHFSDTFRRVDPQAGGAASPSLSWVVRCSTADHKTAVQRPKHPAWSPEGSFSKRHIGSHAKTVVGECSY